MVDLPQPDSPTRPSVSPAQTVRSMPSTARAPAGSIPEKPAPRRRRPSSAPRASIMASESSYQGLLLGLLEAERLHAGRGLVG